MNQAKKNLLVLLLLMFSAACGPSEYMLKSGGDTANIKARSGNKLTGELLCIQDSSIYIVTRVQKQTILRLGVIDVEQIEVEGYANRTWVTPVILFQVIPTVLFTIAAASAHVDHPEVALLIFGVPTLITYVAFEASTPAPPNSEWPTKVGDIQHLQRYCRFPQGLTPDQLQQLLHSYNQTEPEELK
ncbi:MAG: hypothetical protein ACPL7O_10475 [Armatimonadota bacterium]